MEKSKSKTSKKVAKDLEDNTYKQNWPYILIGVGVLFLLDRAFNIFKFLVWEVILIIIGASYLISEKVIKSKK